MTRVDSATSHSPPFSLPLRYMLLGIAGFVLFAVDLVIQAGRIASGGWFAPSAIALTHLLTLGALLSFVMGAVYQLTTVAFLVPLRGLWLARANFWLYVAGLAGLAYSMADWNLAGLLVFGSLTAGSVCLYAVLVLVAVHASAVRGSMRGFVQAAHTYLILAVLAALLLILNLDVHLWPQVFHALLCTHIVLAAGGFFTFLILGFTAKLFPMFTLAHGFSTGRQKYVLASLHSAVWLLLAGIWLHSSVAAAGGGAVAVVAFGLQTLDMRSMYQHRMRKNVEFPIRVAILAVLLGAAASVGIAVMFITHAPEVLWAGIIAFYLLAFVVMIVMSYTYKILPFLVWTHRYGSQAGKEKVPMMAHLLNLDKSRIVYGLFWSGLFTLTVSMPFGLIAGAVIGCFLLASGLIWFTWEMVVLVNRHAVRRQPTP